MLYCFPHQRDAVLTVVRTALTRCRIHRLLLEVLTAHNCVTCTPTHTLLHWCLLLYQNMFAAERAETILHGNSRSSHELTKHTVLAECVLLCYHDRAVDTHVVECVLVSIVITMQSDTHVVDVCY